MLSKSDIIMLSVYVVFVSSTVSIMVFNYKTGKEKEDKEKNKSTKLSALMSLKRSNS